MGGEIESEGLRHVGEIRLPFCARGAVDGGEGELTRLVVGWRAGGDALGDVVWDGGVNCDGPVGEGEGAEGREVVVG